MAWSVGLLPSSVEGWRWSVDGVLLAACPAAVLLTGIPVARLVVPRKHLPRAGRWVPINVVAWLSGLMWTIAPSPVIDETTPVSVLLPLLAGLAMAATVVLVTGIGIGSINHQGPTSSKWMPFAPGRRGLRTVIVEHNHRLRKALTMTSARTIVIGIDDSAPSRAALTWAAEYARTTGDSLEAVHVMNPEVDSPLAWMPGFPTMVYIAETPPREIQQKHIRQIFDAVSPEPHWMLRFPEGPVGPTLVKLSKTAELLVVGTHEHVGLGRLVNGSVSHYCLTRAACPVVAVPPIDSAEPSPSMGREKAGSR